MKQYEAVAKTADEAIEEALAALSATIDEVEIEIFEEASKGLFGFLKSSEYRVIATKKGGEPQDAKVFLENILSDMKIDATIEVSNTDEGMFLNISGENMGMVIGKRGQTLDSLQYLVSLVANKGREDYTRVILDTENYREKRKQSLIKLANKLADKAVKYRKDMRLEPMNPYERRIIHSSLQENDRVGTRSDGKEPYRRVVIYPKKSS